MKKVLIIAILFVITGQAFAQNKKAKSKKMETTEHTLLYCKRFSTFRHTLRIALASSPLFITTPLSVSRIITPASNLISSPLLLKCFFLIKAAQNKQIFCW